MWSALVEAVLRNAPARLSQAPKMFVSKVGGCGVFCQESIRGSANCVAIDSNDEFGTARFSVNRTLSRSQTPPIRLAPCWTALECRYFDRPTGQWISHWEQ